MNFPSRRKPLALIFYYGFFGVLVGANSADAQDAGLESLRVDPVLLGQPPLKPAVVAEPAAAPRAASAEVKPVEPAVVDARPVDVSSSPRETPAAAIRAPSPEPVAAPARGASNAGKASAQQVPARAVAPASEASGASEIKAAPAPAPLVAPAVTLAPAVRTPRAEEKPAATGDAAASASVAKAAPPPEPKAAPEAQKKPELQPEPKPAPVPVARSAATPATAVVAAAPSSAGDAATANVLPLSVDPRLVVSTPSTPSTAKAGSASAAPAASGVAAAPRGATGASVAAPVAAPVTAPVVVAAAPKARLGEKSADKSAADSRSWFQRVWDPVAYAYDHGDWEYYLPFATYHSRSTYSQEQIDSYQERPPGFGIGKGYYNENGNWEGVYALGFQDSHFKPSYTAGYGWKAIWRPADDVRLGLGYIAGLMTREDVMGYVPFPLVIPTASIAYKNFSIEAAYVPPGADAGNVLFFWAKWEMGKKGEAVGTPAPPKPKSPSDGTETLLARQSVPTAETRVPYGPTLSTGAMSAGTPATVAAAAGAEASSGVTAGGGMAWRADDGGATIDTSPALALRSSPVLLPAAKDEAQPRPVFLSAQRMGGDVDREFNAEGEAELRKIGTVVNADLLTYWPIDDEMEAVGNVRLEQGDDVITGPRMRLRLEDQVGYFDQPSYSITIRRQSPSASALASGETAGAPQDDWWNSGFASPQLASAAPGGQSGDPTQMPKRTGEGRGDAERIDFEGENHYRLLGSSFTTCAAGNDDWYLKTSELKLDYDREVAEGSDGTVYFMDTPIFYTPWLSFSLNNQRKSGFLAPSYGSSSNNGFELAVPYYWNIAPNMDATITPTVMSKRGVLLGSELRYMNSAYGGVYNSRLDLDVLPNDDAHAGDTRYALAFQHNQSLANGWSGAINYSKVSDDSYFTDLARSIADTSQVNLLQQGTVTYSGGGWWNATANFQSYQTLQPDAESHNTLPYQMLPQLTVNARKPDLYSTDASFMGQYTNFTIKERVQDGVIYPDGQRTVLYPQLALPYVTPGWYVTPKIGVNYRNYALTGQAADVPASIERTLPIFSVDSGMTFERDSNWFGRDYTQTLEPRFFYLNVPYKDQSQIPIFDTSLADFNFAQIFSENQFSGWDRVSNANQLTVAATSRLLEPDTGNEIMRAMLGQRFYFQQNKVLMPGATTEDEKWDKSSWLGAFSGQVLPRVYADSAIEYATTDSQVQRFSIGSRYQPEPGKVLNAAYRYNRSTTAPIDQVDFSGQWPLGNGWYGVGRLNYGFKDDGSNSGTTAQGGRLIQAVGGVEYNGGCWVLRGVVQRIALTESNASTGFYVQLELSDFSRIGSNPLNILKTNIQGYSLINQPTGLSAQY